MKMEQLLETFKDTMRQKSSEMTPDEYLAWLDSEIAEWERQLQLGRVKYTTKIKARFETCRNFYVAEREDAAEWGDILKF